MKIISVWCGPRNVSTALMYSFAQRPDTRVLDEPFYGHFLVSTPDAMHPGRDEILSKMECDHHKVIDSILSNTVDLLFIKNMGHHLIFNESKFMDSAAHAFLIRDPREMLPSLLKNVPGATMRDTGLNEQLALLNHLKEKNQPIIVLDSKELRTDPEKTLREFCDRLSIPFYKSMLHWQKGARPEDGSWSKYWYHNVHQSTGFAPYTKKKEQVPVELNDLLEECIKIYDLLYEHAIKA